MNSKDLYKVKLQIVKKWSVVNINPHPQIRTYSCSDKYEYIHEKKWNNVFEIITVLSVYMATINPKLPLTYMATNFMALLIFQELRRDKSMLACSQSRVCVHAHTHTYTHKLQKKRYVSGWGEY